jgi:hypothetical protein
MPWSRIAGVAGLESTLPSSPVDGQEVYYQASGTMNTDGIVWHLRYDAASASSYKWEFVGGSKIVSVNNTSEQNTSSSVWHNIATQGPTVTLPLAGDYLISIAASIQTSNGSANTIAIGLVVGDNNPAAQDQAIHQPLNFANAQNSWTQSFLETTKTSQSANTAWKMRYYTAAVTSGVFFASRRISLTPIRVG